jgi:hypothetical protein
MMITNKSGCDLCCLHIEEQVVVVVIIPVKLSECSVCMAYTNFCFTTLRKIMREYQKCYGPIRSCEQVGSICREIFLQGTRYDS